MRVGVLVEAKGLEGRLDLDVLCASIGEGASVMKKLSCAAMVHKISVGRLNGLVVVSADEEAAWERGREALRLTGEDPFALRVLTPLDLLSGQDGREGATQRAGRLLRSAAAMVRQYPWLVPANIRMRVGGLRGRLSRRALLTAPRLRPEVIPAVNEGRCRAPQGCDLCLKSCPFEALTLRDGVAFVDKDRCQDCGLCVTSCPTGAVAHPYYQRPVMEAGLAALLDGGATGAFVALTCRGAMRTLREAVSRGFAYPSSVLPMEVPSAGFADLYLMVRALDLGASGVLLVHCGGACGAACRPAVFQERVLAVQTLLGTLAFGGERVAVLAATSPRRLAADLAARVRLGMGAAPGGSANSGRANGHRPRENARLVLSFWERMGGPNTLTIEHDGLPFGQARLNSGACSLCGLCADSCPTGALRYGDDSGAAILDFDATDCAGCRICSRVCPENALKIDRTLDFSALGAGRRPLKSAGLKVCSRCGQGYAPEAMVARLVSALGDRAVDFRYCPDCRMLAAMGTV